MTVNHTAAMTRNGRGWSIGHVQSIDGQVSDRVEGRQHSREERPGEDAGRDDHVEDRLHD